MIDTNPALLKRMQDLSNVAACPGSSNTDAEVTTRNPIHVSGSSLSIVHVRLDSEGLCSVKPYIRLLLQCFFLSTISNCR